MENLMLTKDVQELRDNVGLAAGFLKKMSHPDRLLICCALKGGELSVRNLEDLLNLRQPSLSQQLAELRDAGLIKGRKEGKQMIYSLADARVTIFIDTMYELFCGQGA